MPKFISMGKRKSTVGCLFWVALILLVLVVFLFNRKTIESVLDRTGLLDHITRQGVDKAPDIVEIPEQAPPAATEPPVAAREPEADRPEPEAPRIVVEDRPAEQVEKPIDEAGRPEKLRRSTLFFVHVSGEGKISLREVQRPVYYVDSPLTETLETLLLGLSPEEIREGLLSLVPAGSQIQGIRILDGVATIDFNESFRFNAFGKEGYRSQLQQIVFTATEFSTVQSVQILVNGARVSYLGPESPYVGEPLDRESL